MSSTASTEDWVAEAINAYSERLGIVPPKFVLGAKMPKRTLAYYNPNNDTIYFGSRTPVLDTLGHEVAHAWHVKSGIPCEGDECERVADSRSDWLEENVDLATFTCEVCGSQVSATPGSAVCLKCGTLYEQV